MRTQHASQSYLSEFFCGLAISSECYITHSHSSLGSWPPALITLQCCSPAGRILVRLSNLQNTYTKWLLRNICTLPCPQCTQNFIKKTHPAFVEEKVIENGVRLNKWISLTSEKNPQVSILPTCFQMADFHNPLYRYHLDFPTFSQF